MKKLIKQLIGSTKKKLTSEEAVETINEVMEMATGEESSEDEKELIKSLVQFRDTTVKQIMTARPDIVGLDWDSTFQEVLEFVSKWQFSRVPVYKEDIDKIEGVLYIKHLFPLLSGGKDQEWQKLIQAVVFIPETKKIDELLKFLQQEHQHLAVIVDEHGVTAGLVTLEDIIEEIIGEIHDEFDVEEKHFNKIDDKTFIFEAKILLSDFCKTLKIDPSVFDGARGESESLGGLMLEINSDLPKKGDKIFYDRFEFQIEEADNKRIMSIKVLIHEEDTVDDKQE